MTRAALLRRRADLLRELAGIDDSLAVLELGGIADEYSTAPGGALPPGRSRRWLRDHAREIPGARRVGGARGRGVVWLVPRAAYEAWLAGRATAPTERAVIDVAPDRWLAGAGLRVTRGGSAA